MKKWTEILRLGRWVKSAGLAGGVGFAASVGFWISSEAIAPAVVSAKDNSATLTAQGVQFEGTTGGDYNLMRLAGRDRRRRLCLGYGDEAPDHVLVLPEAVERLSVSVMSDGDTTLLIDGPKGIDCDDNARRGSRDAAVKDANWPAGTYRIWVGAFERGDRIDYKLSVSESDSDR
ncbi:MAG: hypothetical protein WA947_06000 [Phormidesmis sp.]